MKFGYWIWQIEETEKGDPSAIVKAAVEEGITDVMIKIADGPYSFNVTKAGVDLVPAVIEAFKAVGITVWGWQFIYGYYPVQEATIAIKRVKELGLDKFIIDAESDLKKTGSGAAESYCSSVKANLPNVTLAFTSFRFPSLHMDFPWKPFFKYCSINFPQVYWEGATNAAEQAQKSIAEFKKLAPNQTILPIGAAYKNNGWRPTPTQAIEFRDACERLGMGMVSWWCWQNSKRDLPEIWNALRTTVVTPAPNTDMKAKLQALLASIQGAARQLEDLINSL
jgi:hypothetical protein